MRKFLLGLATGFTLGYSAFHAYRSLSSRKSDSAFNRDAATYGATRRALSLAGIARSLTGSSAVAFGPIGTGLERSVRGLPVWLRPAAFAVEVALLDALVETPVDFQEGYELERRYGLSEQSISSWMSDRVKQEVLGIAITATLSALLAAAMRRLPNTWPYVASAAVFPLLLIANIVVPVYVLPLFNTYEPVDGPLEKRLRALASRYGVGDAEILRVDMSKQTKKANAFVTGIFNTHRIVIGDTLIEHFPDEEIEFVVAHELGHYVSKDSWRMIGAGQIGAILVLFGAFAVARKNGSAKPESPMALAQLQLWATLFSQVLRPAFAAFARSREWAADRFAIETTRDPQTGASAFRRLRDQNLSEDEQPLWYECLFSTHPSLRSRIAALES